MARLRFHFLTILLYTLLTILLYSPNLPTFSTHAIGHPAGNTEKEVRGMWAGMNSIAEYGYVSSKIESMNFPDGGRLFSLQQGGQWLGMLFRPFLDIIAIHNLLYLLNTLLAAIAAMLLARELTNRNAASVVAGAIYGFSATALTFPVVSGVTETSFLFPLPLVLLFSIRSVNQTSLWNPVLAAFFLVLQTIVCWSYGIIAGIMLFLMVILLMVGHRRSWATRNPFLRGVCIDRSLLVRIGVFVLIGAAISLPVYLLVRDAHSGQGAVYSRSLSIWPWMGEQDAPRPFSGKRLSIASYFTPGKAGLVGPFSVDLDWLVYSSYAGFIALLLGIYAAVKGWPGVRFLLVSMCIFMLLSLGYRLHHGIGGREDSVLNVIYYVFWNAFPAFAMTAHSPDRFSVAFQLLLAVSAAGGLATLLGAARHSEMRRWLIGAALSLCVVLETILVSPVPWPFPRTLSTPTASTQWLREQSLPGAVLDLPLYFSVGPGEFQRGDVFMQQVYHERPIPYNYLGVSDSLSSNGFFRRLVGEVQSSRSNAFGERGRACADARAISKMGFSFLVYRPELNPSLFARTRHLLEECFGVPEEIGDALIYRLGMGPRMPIQEPRRRAPPR